MRSRQWERDGGKDPERDGERMSLLLRNDSMTVYYILDIRCRMHNRYVLT